MDTDAFFTDFDSLKVQLNSDFLILPNLNQPITD